MLPAVRGSGSAECCSPLQLSQDASRQGQQAELAAGAALESPVQHAVAGGAVEGLDPVVA